MSASTSDDQECNTPRTSIPDGFPDSELPSYPSLSRTRIGTCPWKGGTYIIRDPETKLVITLKEGVLGLCPEEKGHPHTAGSYHHGRGSHWKCVENKGMWLGFYNSVSGTYIRHNNNKNNWQFDAKGERHDKWERFCAREHPDGGHILLVKHFEDFRPMKIGGKDNRELVVGAEGEIGTPWEFIRVECES
ncbi:conserved hypothetical protein [Paecilomyces variotii No. 5]|uniref:Uncharacterized protein n=1 Tax=Byssochlamys spectabilis (strain No. 5 / NBRC 109023) TaxID=1356009 RepID=V5FNI9_BYSSN|nr:conserved hypothetical protein [Paecilomyces variotii No. 5]